MRKSIMLCVMCEKNYCDVEDEICENCARWLSFRFGLATLDDWRDNEEANMLVEAYRCEKLRKEGNK